LLLTIARSIHLFRFLFVAQADPGTNESDDSDYDSSENDRKVRGRGKSSDHQDDDDNFLADGGCDVYLGDDQDDPQQNRIRDLEEKNLKLEEQLKDYKQKYGGSGKDEDEDDNDDRALSRAENKRCASALNRKGDEAVPPKRSRSISSSASATQSMPKKQNARTVVSPGSVVARATTLVGVSYNALLLFVRCETCPE